MYMISEPRGCQILIVKYIYVVIFVYLVTILCLRANFCCALVTMVGFSVNLMYNVFNLSVCCPGNRKILFVRIRGNFTSDQLITSPMSLHTPHTPTHPPRELFSDLLSNRTPCIQMGWPVLTVHVLRSREEGHYKIAALRMPRGQSMRKTWVMTCGGGDVRVGSE